MIFKKDILETNDHTFIQRCIQLAKNGQGNTAPNPLVGSVVVYNNKIVGEGFHQQYGAEHAEVNALKNIPNEILSECTLYVNLEPCSHFGKTPPCADLIISKGIKRVVIGTLDPYEKVAGRGVEKLQNAGIVTSINHCVSDCNELNKRFFTSILKKRPFVILKYAQTSNGFIGRTMASKHESRQISNLFSQRLTHRWRTEEAAILVGTNTAINDNPKLDTRLYAGRLPTRVIIDRELKIPNDYHIYNTLQPTIIFTESSTRRSIPNTEFIIGNHQSNEFIVQLLSELHQRNIQSILVEGGTKTLQSFIDSNLWDEARVFTAPVEWSEGIKAPLLPSGSLLIKTEKIDTDILHYYQNKL